MKLSTAKKLGLVLTVIGAAFLSIPAQAQVFNGSVSDDYGTGGNWVGGSVPNLTSGATAVININDPVTYNPGGDFVIDNNSTLEVSNGSWTQINNNNWIQLEGNGNILVNGGTFNQGSAGNTPFNISNTGNAFTITSGAANFNSSLASTSAGVTYNFDGGTTTFAGEIDYNTNNNILFDGGIVNATLVTAVNNASNGILTFEAGTLNLSSGFGIYAPATTAPLNFTTGSTASINFEGVAASTVQGWVNTGVVTYNGTTTPADFLVTSTGPSSSVLSAVVEEVPEPSTYVMFGLGLAALALGLRRRASKATL
jgi:hypothetical protein